MLDIKIVAKLFNQDYSLTPGFIQLLQLMDVDYNDHDIKQLHQALIDACFVREKSVERHSISTSAASIKYQQIIDICHNQLKMNNEILPIILDYDAIIMFGSDLEDMLNRLSYYNSCLAQQLISTDKKLYILTGFRELDEKFGETASALYAVLNTKSTVAAEVILPTTELDMIKFVIEHKFPQLTNYEIIYSEAAAGYNRATTVSTMTKFLNHMPNTPANLLAISNQPFIDYHAAVANFVAKQYNENVIVTAVGPASSFYLADPVNYAAMLLDTITQTIGYVLESPNY